MAEAKIDSEWAHTSAILALLANIHRDPKKAGAFTPADFHPLARRKVKQVPKVGIAVLKQVFVDRPYPLAKGV